MPIKELYLYCVKWKSPERITRSNFWPEAPK